jgi:hypothetical protein
MLVEKTRRRLSVAGLRRHGFHPMGREETV